MLSFLPASPTECWFTFIQNHLFFSFCFKVILYLFTCSFQLKVWKKATKIFEIRTKSIACMRLVSTNSVGKGTGGQLFHLQQQWIWLWKKGKFYWPYTTSIFPVEYFKSLFYWTMLWGLCSSSLLSFYSFLPSFPLFRFKFQFQHFVTMIHFPYPYNWINQT